jgi:hypothetical protein
LAVIDMPSIFRRRAGHPPPAGYTTVGSGTNLLEHPESIALQRVDEAAAVAQPDALTNRLWVEHEMDELEREQSPAWVATGEEAARPSTVGAAELDAAKSGDERIVGTHTPLLEHAAQQVIAAEAALAPFRRRAGGKAIHYLIKIALVFGDAVGVTLLSVNLGDIPALSGLMAVSAATAAVTAGLVGSEFRRMQSAEQRARQPEALTPAQQPYAHLFSGVQSGKIVRIMACAAATAAALIAVAIFAGRAEVEGALVGGLYGGIALAVALASFVESYMFADDIADHLASLSKTYDREVKRHRQLSGAQAMRQHLGLSAQAKSISREHELRGKAAQDHVRATKFGVLRSNPGVAGHGPRTQLPEAVGRTPRRNRGAS